MLLTQPDGDALRALWVADVAADLRRFESALRRGPYY